MEYPGIKYGYQEFGNGALILLLLRKIHTWEGLCERFEYADPAQPLTNTNTMVLLQKLFEMREVGLIAFKDEDTGQGKMPVGEIEATDLASKLFVSFGGMSLGELWKLSRQSQGMAVVPLFGRPQQPEQKIDIFVLMPFDPKLERVYTNHIKKMGKKLGVTIQRADNVFSPRPFMDKIWNGICAAQLILADCTAENPNVFYEIGIAHAIGKKVLLITDQLRMFRPTSSRSNTFAMNTPQKAPTS